VRVAEKLSSEAVIAYCVVGSASVSQELGDSVAAKKHLARAAALMVAAPAESPQALAMQLVRGRIALSEGRLDDARAAMSASIGTHVPISLSASSLIERAEVNLMDGKLVEAAADARTGLAAAQSLQAGAPYSNRTGRAWLILGRVLAAQGDQARAAAAFNSAVENLSNTVDATDPVFLLARSLQGTH
jgi:tetratricopeptide (TPR) repeat protein